MNSIKSIWLWLTGFTLIVLIFLALAIGLSYRSSTVGSGTNDELSDSSNIAESESLLSKIVKSTTTKSNQTTSSTEVDPSLPLPAKKLQKLMNDPDLAFASDEEIEKRIQALDKQIEAMNKELAAQGIMVPDANADGDPNADASAADNTNDNDTSKRLSAIKDFMSEKESSSATN